MCSYKPEKNGMSGWRKVATLNELMDEFKTDDVSRRLATVVLASGELGRPYLAAARDTW